MKILKSITGKKYPQDGYRIFAFYLNQQRILLRRWEISRLKIILYVVRFYFTSVLVPVWITIFFLHSYFAAVFNIKQHIVCSRRTAICNCDFIVSDYFVVFNRCRSASLFVGCTCGIQMHHIYIPVNAGIGYSTCIQICGDFIINIRFNHQVLQPYFMSLI